MGYTHYMRQSNEIDQETFDQISEDCRKVCEAADIPLAYEFNMVAKPVFGPDVIRFNGVGDDGHETFLVNRIDSLFCKTAHKPYDDVVCACMIVFNHYLGDKVKITSDGDNDDWDLGRELCEKVLGYGQEFVLD